MKLLGIDLETTGLDPNVNKITEVGAVLYDWDNKKPLMMISELVHDVEMPIEIEKLTGITTQMCRQFGAPKGFAISKLIEMVDYADYCVAHNAKFDRSFLPTLNKPWLCTKTDVKYPENIKTSKLTYLAAEHGFVNPFPHRAVFDVLTMFEVLKNYDIEQVIKRSKEPTVKVVAIVSYENKDKAKDAGFHWKNKRWEMDIKKSDLETKEFNFKTITEGEKND